jgi:hypothetical protein
MLEKQTFPEDRLKLLGPEIQTQAPEDYHARILSLYQPKSSTGKAKANEPKGKAAATATKKRLGLYEVSFRTAMGEKTATIPFAKSKEMIRSHAEEAAKAILCNFETLLAYLEKKNFKIVTCFSENEPLLSNSPQEANQE